MELSLIKEHIGQIEFPGKDETEMTRKLMRSLTASKIEGETVKDFESRLKEEIDTLLQADE